MTIRIDAHHHVWDLSVRDQTWITGAAMAPIRRNFGVGDLREEAAASGVMATVVVQTAADVAESEDLLDLAEADPLIAGVVGFVDLESRDVSEQLDRLLGRPSGARLVGVRSPVQDQADPSWLVRPAVLDGLREVAQRGLTYDLLIRSHQLPAAIRATTEVSDGRFVLDHLAKPPIALGGIEPWASDLAALAARRNVAAKLSGLVTEASWPNWTVADLRPYVDHALAVFGPDRLMFGSDWPVCMLAARYSQVVAAVEDLISALSLDERAAVLGGTAAGIYDLHDRIGARSP